MSGYRLGSFEIDVEARSLRAGAEIVDLPFRSLEALLALVEAQGAVVSRDELHARLWPDAIVDDSSLNKALSVLRKALAAHDPDREYLETVPRRGYRLAVHVEMLGAAGPAEEASPAQRQRFVPVIAAALAVVVVLALGWTAWSRHSRGLEVAAARAEGQQLLRNREYARAAEAFKRAIALDPGNGRAYGELAHTVHRMNDASMDATPAIEIARKGVELDPKCAECQGTLGFFLFYHAWQWAPAARHYEEALRLAPEDSGVHASYAFLLAATGRAAAAQEHVDYAAEAAPLLAGRHSARASILYLNRRYEDAVAAADRAIALDRRQIDAWEYRSRAQFQMGHVEEGVRSLIEERFKEQSAEVADAVEKGGGEAGLQKLLEITGGWKDRTTQSWRRAAWFAVLGEKDAALDEIEEAARARNVNLMFVAVDPLYDRLHGNRRFEGVLESMGLRAAN